ncbi:MAG: hypothetical protein ACP5LI_05980 [Hydrogenobaculum sp.]
MKRAQIAEITKFLAFIATTADIILYLMALAYVENLYLYVLFSLIIVAVVMYFDKYYSDKLRL